MKLAGVDGCRGGWLAILEDTATHAISSQVVASAAEAAALADIVAIDMPIGLESKKYGRDCDWAARKFIGPRFNSVFPAPIESVVFGIDIRTASADQRMIVGKGVSPPCIAIIPQIWEVNRLLRGDQTLVNRVLEVHPEVSFRAMRGSHLEYPKRDLSGALLRLSLIRAAFGENAFEPVRREQRRGQVEDDDILDAFAALWTARRIAAGTFQQLPEGPTQYDAKGLPMRIVY